MKSRQELFEIISQLEKEKVLYLNNFFKNCPDKIIESIKYMKVPREYPIIQAGEICNKAYIILKGKASGIDLQALGNSYVFTEYSDIDVVGDYELFGNIPKYRVSIHALTECELMIIPSKFYLEWMTQDVNALFMRTRKLMNTLTNQTSNERKSLFLGCKERMILYLLQRYEKYGNNKDYTLHKKQSELAERIGVNVRTIQRSIQTLEEEELITSIAGRINISNKQYLKLKEYAEKNLNLLNY